MCGNEPSVTLTLPVNNTTAIINSPLTIDAVATDPDGTVMKVEFFVGPLLIGVDSISPYSIQWTPTQTGVTCILAKAIDNDGKFRFTDANVIEVVNTTGIIENKKKIEIHISPLPAVDVINVSLSDIINPIVIIEVRDVFGKSLIKESFYERINKINISNLTAGIYLISVRSTNEYFIQKIIKIDK